MSSYGSGNLTAPKRAQQRFSKYQCQLGGSPPFTGPFNPAQVIPETQTTRVYSSGGGTNFYAWQSIQNCEVGQIPGSEFVCMVIPVKLPYIPAGQTIVSATLTMQLTSKSSPNASVDLYALNRSTAEAADWLASDYYQGTNDVANTRLAAALVTTGTAVGAVTYAGANLVTWLQGLYTSAGNLGVNPYFGFLRLSSNTAAPTGNYAFAGPNHLSPTLRPVLTIVTAGTPTPTAGQLSFTWNQAVDAMTSAGVYDNSTGKLVRTLWGNVPFKAGYNIGVWDGKDDGGTTLSGSHTVKLLSHNVTYGWDGIVGNQSLANTGANVWRGLETLQCVSFAGGVALASTGYMEQVTALWKFTEGAMNVPTQIYGVTGGGAPGDFRDIFRMCYNDGTNTYFAKASGSINDYLFVGAVINSSGNQFKFGSTAGALNPHYDGSNNPWQYVCDYDGTAGQGNPAAGITVDGTNVYTSHSSTNEIRRFNKLTGAAGAPITSFTAPGPLCWDTTHYLYVLVGTDVHWYDISGGLFGAFGLSLTSPIAIAQMNGGNTLIVVEGGISQRVKIFIYNGTNFILTTTIGTNGGQPAIGPTLTNTDFWFGSKSCIAPHSLDSTFWVFDSNNERWMHYSLNQVTGAIAFIESFEFRGANYTLGMDMNDPTRLFSSFFEYQIDYAHPVTGTTGWKKVKNWGITLGAQYSAASFAGLYSVCTMASNGRTYGIAQNNSSGNYDCIELAVAGPRVTATSFTNKGRLHADESYRYVDVVGSNNIAYSQARTGFTSGDPTYGAATILAQATAATTEPNYNAIKFVGAYVSFLLASAGGYYAVYRGDAGVGFHLGGVPAGGTAWSWLSMSSTAQKAILRVASNPVAGTDNMTVDGVTYSAVASGATAVQFNVGVSIAATMINAAAAINAHSTNAGATASGNNIIVFVKTTVTGTVHGASTFGVWNQNLDPNGFLSYMGGPLINGGFDIGNQTPTYFGNIILTAGRTFVLGFHGEGYKGGEANQFAHYDETGLFIGNFGAPSAYTDTPDIIPFLNNNSFFSHIAQQSGNTYLYHNNEGSLGGMGRISINNLGSIAIKTGAGSPGSVIAIV